MQQDGIPLSSMDEHFRGHMHRGIAILAGRVKSLAELQDVV
jgi:hypothetical protein